MPVVTDNFNRPDAGTLGANWSQTGGGLVQLGILSNAAATVPAQTTGAAWYSAQGFGRNQFSQATMLEVPTTQWVLSARSTLNANNSLGHWGGFATGFSTFYVVGLDNTLISTSSVLPVAGDVVRIETGRGKFSGDNNIRLYVNTNLIIETTTGSAITPTSGVIGLKVLGNANTRYFADWSGGDLEVPIISMGESDYQWLGGDWR